MNNSANYVELCFPAQVNMNGSQPNLASMPINKVGEASLRNVTDWCHVE